MQTFSSTNKNRSTLRYLSSNRKLISNTTCSISYLCFPRKLIHKASDKWSRCMVALLYAQNMKLSKFPASHSRHWLERVTTDESNWMTIENLEMLTADTPGLLINVFLRNSDCCWAKTPSDDIHGWRHPPSWSTQKMDAWGHPNNCKANQNSHHRCLISLKLIQIHSIWLPITRIKGSNRHPSSDQVSRRNKSNLNILIIHVAFTSKKQSS
jgi:hypothetical protein